MPQLAPRKVVGLLLVVALAAIVILGLTTLAGSGAQLRALLPTATVESSVAAPAPTERDVFRAAPPVDTRRAEALPAPADGAAPIQSEPLERDDTLDEPHDEAGPSGPVSGAEFSQLLEDGALGETDSAAAEELRRALAEAAQPEL